MEVDGQWGPCVPPRLRSLTSLDQKTNTTTMHATRWHGAQREIVSQVGSILNIPKYLTHARHNAITRHLRSRRYLLCNPKNTSDSTGPWACTTSLNFSSGLPLPPSCTDVYIAIPGYAWHFAGKVTVLPADTLAKCCALAEKLKIPLWQFFEGNSSCVVGTQMDPKEPNGPHHDGVMAYAKSLVPPPCDCPRVHMTVGRENLTRTYGGNSGDVDPVGGDWFSHPTGGQCAQGAPLGTAGCTWRVIDTKRVIKASCM
jgi:hypothetical protein